MATTIRRTPLRRVASHPARLVAVLVAVPLVFVAGVTAADALKTHQPGAPLDSPSSTRAVLAAHTSRAPSLGKPPAAICGSRGLQGPAHPPAHAKVVRSQNLRTVAHNSRPGTVFWISPGTHTLGRGQYDQVRPKDGQVFIGAPGAVLDGQHRNLYAFAGGAKNVTVSHLTITNFGSGGENNNQGVVNHDAAPGWRVLHNTVRNVAGAAVFMGNHNRVISNC